MLHPLLLKLALLSLAACAADRQALGDVDEEEIRRVTADLENSIVASYAPSGYRWHVADPGVSVQFGLPETDARALRIDCIEGRLVIMAPANTNAEEGAPASALFNDRLRREGSIHYLGDGPNIAVPVALDDPVVADLLAHERIRIDTADTHTLVPSAGAGPVLGPLIQTCRGR